MTAVTKTKTKTAPEQALPLTVPSTSNLGHVDLIDIGSRRLYERMRALDLDIPEPVAVAVRACHRAAAWVSQPRTDVATARAEWTAALIEAATAGKPQPPSDGLADAALREGALRVISESMRDARLELAAAFTRSVRRGIDEMLSTLSVEHDRLTDKIRRLASDVPSSVTTADAALRSGCGQTWLDLTEAADRWLAVRDCRERASRLDHVAGAEEYSSFRNPSALPMNHVWPEAPALRAMSTVVDTLGAQPWCPSRSQIEQRIAEVSEGRRAAQRKPRAARVGLR